MRIGLVATLDRPVGPGPGGSVEAFVWLLARELIASGHDVTVFGAAGSQAAGARVIETLPGPTYSTDEAPLDWHVCEWLNLSTAVAQARELEIDVLHSNVFLWGAPLARLAPCPMVQTLHIWPYRDDAVIWSIYPDAHVSALSAAQWRDFPALHPVDVVHHGINVDAFTFRPEPDDYVCYFGRFTAGKGPRDAIVTAREAGLRLLMAGPENSYFRQHLRPLVDGRAVEYIGELTPEERSVFLSGARALLYPVRDPEPFGLVMIEAMMCGTPVVATGIGAVPEIVDHGRTGVVVKRRHLGAGLHEALELDRHEVRRIAEDRFSAEVMARRYAEVYTAVLRRAVVSGTAGT